MGLQAAGPSRGSSPRCRQLNAAIANLPNQSNTCVSCTIYPNESAYRVWRFDLEAITHVVLLTLMRAHKQNLCDMRRFPCVSKHQDTAAHLF